MEHLGAERLTDETARELERFLGQHSSILLDREALDRIQAVTCHVGVLEYLVVLFGEQT